MEREGEWSVTKRPRDWKIERAMFYFKGYFAASLCLCVCGHSDSYYYKVQMTDLMNCQPLTNAAYQHSDWLKDYVKRTCTYY